MTLGDEGLGEGLVSDVWSERTDGKLQLKTEETETLDNEIEEALLRSSLPLKLYREEKALVDWSKTLTVVLAFGKLIQSGKTA